MKTNPMKSWQQKWEDAWTLRSPLDERQSAVEERSLEGFTKEESSDVLQREVHIMLWGETEERVYTATRDWWDKGSDSRDPVETPGGKREVFFLAADGLWWNFPLSSIKYYTMGPIVTSSPKEPEPVVLTVTDTDTGAKEDVLVVPPNCHPD